MIGIEGIERIVEPVLERLGLALHHAELKHEGKELVLRLVVDKAHKADASDGVTVDELAVASDEVGAMLDLENPIDDRYRLTLESPGIERDLSTWRQFHFAVGEQVRIVTRGEDAGVIEGVLKAVNDENRQIVVSSKDGEKSVDSAVIKSARTVFDWDTQKGTKRKF